MWRANTRHADKGDRTRAVEGTWPLYACTPRIDVFATEHTRTPIARIGDVVPQFHAALHCHNSDHDHDDHVVRIHAICMPLVLGVAVHNANVSVATGACGMF